MPTRSQKQRKYKRQLYLQKKSLQIMPTRSRKQRKYKRQLYLQKKSLQIMPTRRQKQRKHDQLLYLQKKKLAERLERDIQQLREQYLQVGQDLLEDEALEKTRGQTTALKEATKVEEKEESPKKPRVPRESTMAVTAQEGAELIQGEDLEKTRAQTAAQSPTTPTRVKRTTTIAQTTEGALIRVYSLPSTAILGEEARGRTRSQTRKRSESEGKKPAVKRVSTMAQTTKEGEEFLQRETKRAKHEGDEEEGVGEGEEAAATAED